MSEKNVFSGTLSRRKLLKAGAVGACSLFFAGITGCRPEQQVVQETPQLVAQKGFINPVRALWFSELDNARVRCELCPKLCVLAENERALCRVRENKNGVGYTLAYGNPALVQEDPIERKPFFHVMPGSRVMSISTAGCNLACKFCEVWDMALVAPEEVHAFDMQPEKVIGLALAANVRAISYAIGEPVAFYEYMAAMAALAKEAGLLNLVHTAGYIQPEPLNELSNMLDAANVDLKSFEPAFYRDVVGGELEPVLKTLQSLREAGIHIEITNTVIPTLNDNMGVINEMCKWIINELGPDVPVHFARFYPLYKLSALPRTPVSTLVQARETAFDAGLKFAYIAKVIGHEGENTFCPTCGKMLIKRVGFVIAEQHLENGTCNQCGTLIPGMWN
ncbi:MAG TPA: AmmeMemoRadiSam system radical SAM enzyme [Candidatus Limnocylindrales bacterium]|nr:AmmeMemoRadiSam system radical SAM enzyme [Candidatus Limnocylindrales bacterium]